MTELPPDSSPAYQPADRWQRVFLRAGLWKTHHGVRVCATTGSKELEARAIGKVFAALDVLAVHAPAQLARLPRYMLGLTVAPLDGALGAWRRDLASCVLQEAYTLADATTPEALASTIVHELTHARLGRAGFPYEGPARARSERVCFLAERNFAARLPASAARDALEALVARYLAMSPDYWSDAAVARRRTERRARRPWWLRVAGRLVDCAQWLRRRAAA